MSRKLKHQAYGVGLCKPFVFFESKNREIAALSYFRVKYPELLKTKSAEEAYDEAFAGHKEISLLCHNLDETFPFFYVIRVPGNKRTEFIVSLKEQGIETGIHYIPNHIQPFFQKNYGEPSLPVTEQVAKEIVTLPLFYEMTDEQITYVIDNVLKFFV